MKKLAAALISSLLITTVYADTTAPAPSTTTAGKSDAKRDAMNEKHIKDLHAQLKITASEETLWETVANTMRANVSDIDKIVDAREAGIKTATAVDDLNAYGSIAQAHADSVKKMAVAFTPLYAAMPDAQKKIADEVFTERSHDKAAGKSK